MRNVLRVLALSILLCCLITGCSLPWPKLEIGEAAGSANETADMEDAGENGTDGMIPISSDEEAKIKALIQDYFTILYSEPVQDLYMYTINGTIPVKIKGLISKDTSQTAEGNREIGLHLPRFIETNGLVCISYDISNDRTAGEEQVPDIKADLVGTLGGGYLYYVKINLSARCISTSDFKQYYTQNEADHTWKKVNDKPIDENWTDTIRLQARYDVQVVKEEDGYKLKQVKEAITTSDTQTRLLLYNNDFIKRLSYIDCSKTQDGNYVNEQDGRVYEEEKALITSFFSSLKNSLNRENFNLLQTAWERSAADFHRFLEKIAKSGDEDEKKFNELIELKEDYKTQFDYNSLPLQLNMERLEGELSEMEITPHPGYSLKTKIYCVTFKVPVVKVNGSVQGEKFVYQYDYYVMLSKTDDRLAVSGIKLIEFRRADTGSVASTNNS